MKVLFWGVRGSVPVSGARYIHTGGNTSCVEVQAEGERLILDAGTGIRGLGEALGAGPHQVRVLFSRVHWDHIQGLPFFGPAFHPGSTLDLYGIEPAASGVVRALKRQGPPAWRASSSRGSASPCLSATTTSWATRR